MIMIVIKVIMLIVMVMDIHIHDDHTKVVRIITLRRI